MPRKDKTSDEAVELRKQAESVYLGDMARISNGQRTPSADEAREILHELRVHEIELDMQNDELRRAQVALEALRARYFDLYDLAPVGYITLSQKGLILESNLTASTLLGIPRSTMVNHLFHRLLHKEDQDIHYKCNRQLFETGKSQSYEVRIIKSDGQTFWAHLTAVFAQADQGEPTARIVISDITERKEAENVLRESRDQLNRALDAAKAGTWVWDLRTNENTWSDELWRLYGINPEEGPASYDLWINSIHPDQREQLAAQVCGATQAGLEINLEWRVNDPDEPGRWIMSRGQPERDENGRLLRYLGTVIDITERKMAEEALREKEQRLRDIAFSLADWLWEVDNNNVYTYSSSKGIELFGDVIGKTPFDFMSPGEAQRISDISSAIIDAKAPFKDLENWMLTQTGEQICLLTNAVPILDRDGNFQGYRGIDKDITRRKRAEEALRQSEEKFRLLTENIKDVVWVLDTETMRFSYVSPSVEKLRGYTPEEIIALPVTEALTPESAKTLLESIHEKIAALRSGELQQSAFYRDEVEQPCKDGTTVWTEIVTSYYINKETGRVEVRGVTRDISERRQAEAERVKLQDQLMQSQKIESVGRLAGGVAHDFNNMLGVILGHVELAMEELEPALPVYADLEEIQKAASRSADLTRQLLAFARKQTVAPKVIDLNETVGNMLKMLQRLIGENISLHWMPGNSLWPIKIDPSQMDQILANLCVNARDAMGTVGKITIETANTALNAAFCFSHPGFVPGDFVRIVVTDNGRGMDEETIKHIFEPFFTSKELGKGTGLGLATVYGAIAQNKGFIDVISSPKIGTTFTMYLPRYVAKAEEIAAAVKASPPKRGNETVLLVEDEPGILRLTTRLLKKHGYTVLAALAPGEAIHLATEHPGDIHILVTDVVMPEMNGRDLAQSVMKLYPRIRRLFMSGYTADVIANHGVIDEGVSFIQKPFSTKALAAKVREILDLDDDSLPL